MRLRNTLVPVLALLLLVGGLAGAAPAYRSFIEWNGPYYHVRHALNADSSAYLNYLVNNPLPLYGSPFSSPTAVVMYGSVVSPMAFVADHDHRRVQVFNASANWKVEALAYSATPVQGNFGVRAMKFSYGQVLPGSEQIVINGRPFTRVSSLTGYTLADSVYSIVYDGVPNTGGVATLSSGWNLGPFDSVRVEYSYSNPPGTPGMGEIDYVLYQTTPTDIPLQLHEGSCATDPGMSDLSAIAVNGSVRPGTAVDLYLVNALPGGAGSLASYDLTATGAGGVFNHVDTYPGLLNRPYDVEIVDRGINVAGSIAEAVPSGCNNARLTESVINQSTFLGHDYRITYSFDTSSTMNPSSTPDNQESDLAFDPVTGRLHLVFCRDNAAQGTAYSYSDDYGRTWSAALTISPATLTAAHDRPRVAVRRSGEVHVVYEAVNGGGERHLYHTYSLDGVSWATTTELTTALTPAFVTENRYANLLIDPVTDAVHLVWAGDDDVYHRVFTTSWGGTVLAASGAGTGFSAPHVVMDAVGRLYCAYVSNATPPCAISYLHFNGAVWGSYDGGGFTAGTPDPVTAAAGFADDGSGRGEVFPFPQIALTGDSIWIFWIGTGTETYGTNQAQLLYDRVSSADGDFAAGAGTAVTTGDDCAPLRFTVSTDAQHNLHIVYPYGTTVDREGLRYKTWTAATDTWFPLTATTGRHIYNAGTAATIWAYEPRLITPSIAGQIAPMLVCAKAYTGLGGGSPRILFKLIDGALTLTDQTTLSEFNQWRVWTHNADDASAIPGLSFTIANSAITVSNTDDVDGSEFNVGDYFELDGTPAVKSDLLFLTDSDGHRVKVIRAYEDIDNCFAGDERWDVPGRSDGSPSQTYKLATVGGESSFRVWASPDSTAWTVVDNLLIAGPSARVCEINRYTKELRFGDNAHGLVPPAGTLIRVRYLESVDEAEFGRLGSGPGQMNYPRGLAVRYNTSLGQYDVYTCDAGNNRLQKWAYRPNSAVDPANWTNAVTSWNTAASDTDFISSPEDVEVVELNNSVYLVASDNSHSRLLIYRDDGAAGTGGNAPPVFVEAVGGWGMSLNGFMDPRGLSVMAEDSGLLILAADADRDVVAKLMRRDWLTPAVQDTSDSTSHAASVLTLSLMDALDGDGYLLLQPGAVRTLELRVARTDSLVALRAYATFPANMMDILSINEGNLWSGERYTNKVFLCDFDNTAGRLEVNAAMVGDDDGLSSSGSRVVATLLVQADSALAAPSSGQIQFTDSTELRKASNTRITSYNRPLFYLRGGYLADIATNGGNPGRPPVMIPQPDGRINFADVNVFTQGWNGNGYEFDPIADLGPYSGTAVPRLVADPDKRLDAYDLLALSTMYNWYNGSVPLMAPPPPRHDEGLDAATPMVAAVRHDGSLWTVELQARDVNELTSAHLYLEVVTAGGTVLAARVGDFLGAGCTLFLQTVQGTAVDISMGRLNRENPCVSGSGVLAVVDIALPGDEPPVLRLVYELRDHRNDVLAAGEGGRVDVQTIPDEFSLSAPYPNPFNSNTVFTLNLSGGGKTSLRVFNVLGQEVAKLVDRELPAGVHRVFWDARDAGGKSLASGLYLARLESSGRSDIRKVVLIR
jgi:hypothetical protein